MHCEITATVVAIPVAWLHHYTSEKKNGCETIAWLLKYPKSIQHHDLLFRTINNTDRKVSNVNEFQTKLHTSMPTHILIEVAHYCIN